MEQKPLTKYILENDEVKDDIFVNITVYNIPESLVRNFVQKVVLPNYPRGTSEALRDLMKKEIQKRNKFYTYVTDSSPITG